MLLFDVASNPEFLREGAAISDFMRPDRVVVGTDSEKAREVMKEVYDPLFLLSTPFVFTGPESAELIKYAANAFLAMKISFINEMSALCEEVGADVVDLAKGVGLDGRIGSKFLHPGLVMAGPVFLRILLLCYELPRNMVLLLVLLKLQLKLMQPRKRIW